MLCLGGFYLAFTGQGEGDCLPSLQGDTLVTPVDGSFANAGWSDDGKSLSISADADGTKGSGDGTAHPGQST